MAGTTSSSGKWLSNKTVENVTRWIAQSHFLVAEEAGTLLGVAAMNATGKITLNYVLPEARFSGVSKALVQQLEVQARVLGLRECALETTQTARRFYESLGYTKVEETYPLSLTGLPATVLRKNLETSPMLTVQAYVFVTKYLWNNLV